MSIFYRQKEHVFSDFLNIQWIIIEYNYLLNITAVWNPRRDTVALSRILMLLQKHISLGDNATKTSLKTQLCEMTTKGRVVALSRFDLPHFDCFCDGENAIMSLLGFHTSDLYLLTHKQWGQNSIKCNIKLARRLS